MYAYRYFSLILCCLLFCPALASAIDIPGATDPSTDRIDWAAAARGTTITATVATSSDGGFTKEELIDEIGSKRTDRDIGFPISPSAALVLDFGQPRSIDTFQLHFWDGDSRFYRYLVEQSLDGVTYRPLINKSVGDYRGIQRDSFPLTVTRFLKITGTYVSSGSSLWFVDELLAIGPASAEPVADQDVTIDGILNSGNVSTVGKTIELNAGIYEVTFRHGAISHWSADSNNNGRTWEASLIATAVTEDKQYDFGLIHDRLSRFATAAEAEAEQQGKQFTFLIRQHGKMAFWNKDDLATDNRGSVTISLRQLSGPNDTLLELVRDAMNQSVLWEQKEVANWQTWVTTPANRGCYGCHVHSQASYGLAEAKKKLADLPVDQVLENEFVDAYIDFQNPAGWVSPQHGGSYRITQTSLWAWAVGNVSTGLFQQIAPRFISALAWLLPQRNADGSWNADHDGNYIYNDGTPSATHTAGNIIALRRAVAEFGGSNFYQFADAITQANTVTFLSNPGRIFEIGVVPQAGVTGVRVTVADSFSTNGNFVLNEFKAYDGTTQLAIASATANLEQGGFPVTEAFDGIENDGENGWAINTDSHVNPGRAVFAFATPQNVDRLAFIQMHDDLHQIEKLTVEFTTDPSPNLNSSWQAFSGVTAGMFFGGTNGLIDQYKQAIRNAAKVFAASGWDYRRNTRTAAQTIIGLQAAKPFLTGGDLTAADARLAEINTYLRLTQNTDGGWSDARDGGQPSLPFPSAQALRALMVVADQGLDEQIVRGANYLLGTQRADGSWASAGLQARLTATTWVEIALPTIFELLQTERERSIINDLTAEGNLNSVELSWSPVAGAVGYNIYRRLESGSFAQIAENHHTDVASYTDAGLANEANYLYVVRWLDQFGAESNDSNEASGTPFGMMCGGDSPPIIRSAPVTGAIITKPYAYQVEAEDPDAGSVLTFSLRSAPQGMSINPQTGRISWVPDSEQGGTQLVQLRVTDQLGRWASQAYRIQVSSIVVNVAPQIVSSPLTSTVTGHQYVYPVKAKDPNTGDVLTYSLTAAPTGMNINPTTGRITWLPAAAQSGTTAVGIRVQDLGGLSASQNFQLVIAANGAPSFVSAPVTAVTKSQPYIYNVAASDPDGDRLSFSLDQQAPGMFIEPVTGRVSWTPTSNTIGQFPITIRATDPFGAFAQQSYSLAVLQNEPPIITSSPITAANVATAYTYQVVATDPEGKAITYALTTPPSGMTISAQGKISWTPADAQVGNVNIIVTARDPEGLTAQQSFGIAVAANPAPTISVSSPIPGTQITKKENVQGSVQFPNGVIGTWTAALRGVSNGSEFAVGNGTGSVTNGSLGSIDPTLLSNDSYLLRVSATVAGNTISKEFPYEVTGRLKFGDFQMAVTDLTIPLAGIAIDISRAYSTLDFSAHEFGSGWRLRLAGSVRDSAPSGQPYVTGTRVFVTKPDGNRVGFTFAPVYVGGILPLWAAYFRPDTGVTDFLEVDAGYLFFSGGAFFDFSGNFNPSTFTLTTKDRVRYRIDEAAGLLEVRDANDNTLTFSADTIAHSSGTIITIKKDASGRWTDITDPSGKGIHYTYDGAGDLINVRDQLNQITTYRYDAHRLREIENPEHKVVLQNFFDTSGRLYRQLDADLKEILLAVDPDARTETITDRRGFPTTNTYDAVGNLIRKKDPLNNIWDYTYDGAFNRLTEKDPQGRTTTYTYDSRSNLLSVTDPLGHRRRYEYNNLNQVTLEENPLGAFIERTYDGRGNQLTEKDFSGKTKSFTYDVSGNLTKITNRENEVTEFTYDESGRIKTVKNGVNDVTSFDYDNNGNLVKQTSTRKDKDGTAHIVSAQIEYDALNRPIKLTDGENKVVKVEYNHLNVPTKLTDARNNVVVLEYDEQGRRTKKIYPDTKFELYTPDAEGNIEAIKDRRGNVTQYRYDKLNRMDLITYPGAGPPTKEFKYDPLGRLTEIIDERGKTTSFEYDDAGRLKRRTDPLNHAWQYDYDSANNLEKETDPENHVTEYHYDASNRLARVTAPGTTNDTVFAYDAEGRMIAVQDEKLNTTEYSYDDVGRLTRVTDAKTYFKQFGYDAVGNRISEKDEKGKETVLTFDNRGLLLSRKLPNNETERFYYDDNGNRVRHEDFEGEDTLYEYDALNRLVKMTDPETGITQYGYDDNGNRNYVKDPNTNVTTFDYDVRNRLWHRIDARGKQETFGYDGVGNLTEHIDRNNHKTTFDYDAANRREKEKWFDGTTLIRDFSFSYDDRGNRQTASDSESSYVFTFDERNRLETATKAAASGVPAVVLTYGYDDAGNLLSITDNFGVSVVSTYSEKNQLRTRSWSGAALPPRRADFDYDERGGLREIKRFNDIAGTQLISKTVRTYDEVNRTDSIVHQNAVSSPLDNLLYQYDRNNRLFKEIRNSSTSTLLYDKTHQLKTATGDVGADEVFSYDLGGNRNSAGYGTGAANRVNTDGSYNYSYDDEGNQTAKTAIGSGEKFEYVYDYRNRLTQVTRKNSSNAVLQTVTFTYDPDNRRIKKSVDGVARNFVYDREHVWVEYDAAGNELNRYLYGDSIDEILARWTPSSGTTWYLTDKQGSVVGHLDASGNLVNQTAYKSFGEIDSQTNPAVTDRYGFTGREYDSETGLYYYRGRYFDPKLGRFLSEDPIDFDGGDVNLYRYAGNGPANGTDPMGTLSIGVETSTLLKVSLPVVLYGLTPEPVKREIVTDIIRAASTTKEGVLSVTAGIVNALGLAGAIEDLTNSGEESVEHDLGVSQVEASRPGKEEEPKPVPPVPPGDRDCSKFPKPPNEVEVDRSPPSDDHFPCPGDHWHCWIWNQNQKTCEWHKKRLFAGCLKQGEPGPLQCEGFTEKNIINKNIPIDDPIWWSGWPR